MLLLVSIPACHAGDPGSIPGNGAILLMEHSGKQQKIWKYFSGNLSSTEIGATELPFDNL